MHEYVWRYMLRLASDGSRTCIPHNRACVYFMAANMSNHPLLLVILILWLFKVSQRFVTILKLLLTLKAYDGKVNLRRITNIIVIVSNVNIIFVINKNANKSNADRTADLWRQNRGFQRCTRQTFVRVNAFSQHEHVIEIKLFEMIKGIKYFMYV